MKIPELSWSLRAELIVIIIATLFGVLCKHPVLLLVVAYCCAIEVVMTLALTAMYWSMRAFWDKVHADKMKLKELLCGAYDQPDNLEDWLTLAIPDVKQLKSWWYVVEDTAKTEKTKV